MVHQTPIRVQVDQEINIAIRTRFAACYGANDSDVMRAVFSSDLKNNVSFVF